MAGLFGGSPSVTETPAPPPPSTISSWTPAGLAGPRQNSHGIRTLVVMGQRGIVPRFAGQGETGTFINDVLGK